MVTALFTARGTFCILQRLSLTIIFFSSEPILLPHISSRNDLYQSALEIKFPRRKLRCVLISATIAPWDPSQNPTSACSSAPAWRTPGKRRLIMSTVCTLPHHCPSFVRRTSADSAQSRDQKLMRCNTSESTLEGNY